MSVKLSSEDVNSSARKRRLRAFSGAVSRQLEAGLPWRNRVFGSVLQSQFHDASVVFPQCRRVEESQACYKRDVAVVVIRLLLMGGLMRDFVST